MPPCNRGMFDGQALSVPKVILDTDILSEIIKERNKAVLTRAARYLGDQPNLSFTSISVVEILSGLHAKDAKKQLAKAETFLSFHDQIIPDAEDYLLTAKILGDLTRTGKPIGWNDPVIAACAIRRGLAIATGNTKHYQQIVSLGYILALENWRDE